MPDDDADSLMRRAEWLREIAAALSDGDAARGIEEFAAELAAKAEALLKSRNPPTEGV